jgi:hypothetical protein
MRLLAVKIEYGCPQESDIKMKRPPTETGERTRPGVPRRPGLVTGTVCAAGRSVSADFIKVWGSGVDLSQIAN